MTYSTRYPLLAQLSSPADLRELPESQLAQVSEQLRAAVLDVVSQSGGHLAAGLGTIELTVALHYVFNTPEDRLIWDVGHQAYPHKILTGRLDQMTTIRQKEGLHPFPNRAESEYDAFGVGHSSTSISAALGMSLAATLKGEQRHSIAVIGDGAMTAGMAFEALNHAGHTGANLLVILNDNDMSISENVGALNNYLAKLLSGRMYSNFRRSSKKIFSHLPGMEEIARRAEEHLKGMVTPGTLFEELGFNYIGPVDGHDLPALIQTMKNMRSLKGPQFLHVATKKGKGYAPAEKDPIAYHAVSAFDPKQDQLPKHKAKQPSYSNIFGQWICDIAAQDASIVAITPAMREGSDLVRFSKTYPERYFDVAIAEQHAVTLAAGLACEGMKPVVAIYSSFLQRGYDQLIHDVALQQLPVLFAIDRAGLVSGDGATHQGAFDISYLRCIPNLVLMTPSNENECRQLLYTGAHYAGCAAVRYPRGTGPGVEVEPNMQAVTIGKGVVRREGSRVAILGFGPLVNAALEIADTLDATVVDMRFVKPLDEALIQQLAKTHSHLVTLEDNVVMGGAGSAVLEYLAQQGIQRAVLNIGLPDRFIDHGDSQLWHQALQLDAAGLQQRIEAFLTKS